MDRSRNFSLLIATLFMACVFAVACDSGTQEPAAPEPSTPSSDAMDSGSDSAAAQKPLPRPLTTDLPEGVTAKIPDVFPNDVPIYPGAVPAMGKGGVSNGVPMAAVTLQTMDSPEQVFDFYSAQLASDGWTIDSGASSKNSNSLSATNGECTAKMLAAPTGDGGTDIFLITEC